MPHPTSNNYLNLFGYVMNVTVTYIIGASSRFNDTFSDNATVSAKYQTLITPAGWAFSIWGIIFLSQAIFVLTQFFIPSVRSTALVQNGVSHYYFYACIAQALWTVPFGLEIIWLSVLFMALILLSLSKIVSSDVFNGDASARVAPDASSVIASRKLFQFWILKFPFYIHYSWILVAFAVNINLMLVAWNVNASLQVAAAFVSLCYVIVLAVQALRIIPFHNNNKIDYTTVLVLLWAMVAIANELQNPKDIITNSFSTRMLLFVEINVYVAFFTILVMFTVRILSQIRRSRIRQTDETSTKLTPDKNAAPFAGPNTH